jgi:L-fucose isomerase-like protein
MEGRRTGSGGPGIDAFLLPAGTTNSLELRMEALRIAFLPLIRTTFDVVLAEQVASRARQTLLDAGFSLVGPQQAITDLPAAEQAAKEIPEESVDLLLIFQATFADSTMAVALSEASDVPIFLWAIPEPWTGGRLRLNSLCGINLAGHALTRRGKKYEYYYGDPDDVGIIRKVRALAAAGRLRRQLQSIHLGVVGEHPDGLDTCTLDGPALERHFGIKVEKLELNNVFMRANNASKEDIEAVRTRLDTRLENLDNLDQKPLSGTLGVYLALKGICAEENLNGLAVRCWPEFFTELGCAACGAISMMSDGFGGTKPIPCSCEADINGTVTQLMLQLLADSPAFGTDMVGVDIEHDTIALWHCGQAPLSMADPGFPARGGVHSNRGLPLIMDFPLKPGKITFARVSQATGDLRLVLGRGEMLAVPKPFSGTSGTLKLEIPAQRFLDCLLYEGLEHHISIVYGDHLDSLMAFAKLVQIPILNLSEEVKP